MHRIQLSYRLVDGASEPLVGNPLIDLLHAVQDNGSISAAARQLGLSYRHVWGELKRWESALEHELIVWERGQSARLTEFGTKLLWAEREAQTRLLPQIERLRADIERAFAVAFDEHAHVLSFYASHDDALSSLREHAQSGLDHERLHLDIRFTGSLDALRALNEGRCTMAGFHTMSDAQQGSFAQRAYKPLLRPGLHKIIGFVRRTQGLIVPPGNPLGLNTLQDAAHHGARFARRTLGSGTRLLLDELLAREHLFPESLHATDESETSHASVAQAVASGRADVGLGIAAAAAARGLDFVPLVEERYHLACLKSALDEPGVQILRNLLASQAWLERIESLPGYGADDSGQVRAMSRVLPWWRYRTRKHEAA